VKEKVNMPKSENRRTGVSSAYAWKSDLCLCFAIPSYHDSDSFV
jgi:hypothetical protein